MVYGRRADGRFYLQPDADGDRWAPDWPVLMVDWWGAAAFARWLAAETGQPWRLPWELEWEKAARGVDGRRYPWGGHLEPSWCRMRESARPRSLPTSVRAHPMDCSPYGVRGTAGNAFEWCGAAAEGDVDARPRVVRGGAWSSVGPRCQSAVRASGDPTTRSSLTGFRVARGLAAPSRGPTR